MRHSGWVHIVLCTLIIALALVLRLSVMHVVTISGDNCSPQLLPGDRVAVLQQAWCDSVPQRGGLVVFAHPSSCDSLFAGKIAALPGDTLWIDTAGQPAHRCATSVPVIVPRQGQQLKVDLNNMRLYNQAVMLHEPAKSTIVNDRLYVSGKITRNLTFAHSYYWITASNPECDSRTMGLIPASRLRGRVLCVLYSHDPAQPLWQGWRWARTLTTPPHEP